MPNFSGTMPEAQFWKVSDTPANPPPPIYGKDILQTDDVPCVKGGSQFGCFVQKM